MSFPGDNLMGGYEPVRGRDDQSLTVRQAYDEGKFLLILPYYLFKIVGTSIHEFRWLHWQGIVTWLKKV